MSMAVRLSLAALLVSVPTGCAAPWSKPSVTPGPAAPMTVAAPSVGADCGSGPLVISSEVDSPGAVEARELVEAFIADFHEAW